MRSMTLQPFVEGLAEAAFSKPCDFGRDVRDGALGFNEIADAVGVIGMVGMDDAALGQVACER